MTSSEQALPHSYYVKILRNKLPPGAFAASPRKLWAVAAHLVVIAASYSGIRHSPFVALSAVLSLIIGHSLACIAFQSHELSHKAIVRHRSLRYPLEVFLWGLNLMPATLWQRIHNHSHHVYGNTIHDPDRYYLKSEMEPPDGRVVRWYALLFLPHRHTPIWNPLVWLHFITYIARHFLAFCYPGKRHPRIVTHKPDYTRNHRIRIILELAFMVFLQFAIFQVVGARLQAYIWASPIPLCFASCFVMAYIWTNHYLHGLYDIHDPVASSTSVIVPAMFDTLHSHFSCHTEHHVFPSMNSDFYPLVSQLLRETFPDKYHRIPIGTVWKELFRGESHVVEPNEV